jgi:GntP family gluconate:H+ symporter
MNPTVQMVLALIIGFAVLIFLIMKTKIHVFLALILASAFIGLCGGMPMGKITASITSGFGGTLGSIGIIIGFGVMMGQIMEESGAAKIMAATFIKLLGKGREEWALAATGYIVSIPIFADSGFVILAPLAKALSKKSHKSVVAIMSALAAGLVVSHVSVPPTPGPLAVAGIYNVNVGHVIALGFVLGLLPAAAAVIYSKWIGKRIYQIPGDAEDEWIRKPYEEPRWSDDDIIGAEKLPSAFLSFMPIVLPILLIFVNTAVSAAFPDTKSLPVTAATSIDIIKLVGNPVIAVAIGLIIAIYGFTKNKSRHDTLEIMEKGIRSAGMIILVTGGGGALNAILRDSGAGQTIADLMVKGSFPLILLPFVISAILRFIQGSGTVAMMTAASISAPILYASGMGYPGILLSIYSCCLGTQMASIFNDSYFWLVTRSMGLKATRDQILGWTMTSFVIWIVALVEIIILSFFMK